jgi:carbon monoxide dehydrogenase subunit G
MQEVSESFEVARPADQVWELFQDIPRVVTCMPGLDYLGETEAGGHAGRVRMKLGPISANFEGKATFSRIDPEHRTAELHATGVDRKGGSQARADVIYAIAEIDRGRSTVTLSGTIRLAGALANLGRSAIVADVARHLTKEFADNLHALLDEAETSEQTLDAKPGFPDKSRREPAQAIRATTLIKVVLLGWLQRLGLARN